MTDTTVLESILAWFNTWTSTSAMNTLTPTLVLYAGAGLSILLLRFVQESKRADLSRMWTITILLFSAWLELQLQFSAELGATLLHDPFCRFFRLTAVSGFALLAIFLPTAANSEKTHSSQRKVLELTYPLLLLSVGGICFLAAAYDLMTLFIGIELSAIPTYLYFRGISQIEDSESSRERSSNSAGELRARFLRVFGYGIFSSLILIFGLAVLYGIGGETNFLQLRVNISIVFLTYKKIGPSLILAIALLSAGLAAKMGLAPFHLWMGEFHASRRTGALPIAILTGLITGIIAIARIFDNTLIAFSGDVMAPLDWAPALTAIFTITMFLTVIVIIREQSVRRLLLWVALAQGAFAVIGVISSNSIGLSGVLIQTLFTIITLAIILPMVERITPSSNGNRQDSGLIHELELTDLTGLARQSPMTAGILILSLASLAAVPFTGGFVGRMNLIQSALDSQQWWAFSLIVGVSVAILFAIGRLIKIMIGKTDSGNQLSEPSLSISMRLAAVITCAVIIYVGISPTAVEELTVQAVKVFGL